MQAKELGKLHTKAHLVAASLEFLYINLRAHGNEDARLELEGVSNTHLVIAVETSLWAQQSVIRIRMEKSLLDPYLESGSVVEDIATTEGQQWTRATSTT